MQHGRLHSFRNIKEVQHIRKFLANFAEMWHDHASQPSGPISQ